MKLQLEIDLDSINNQQLESLRATINRARLAHYTNIQFRINGNDELVEADWIKHLTEANHI